MLSSFFMDFIVFGIDGIVDFLIYWLCKVKEI